MNLFKRSNVLKFCIFLLLAAPLPRTKGQAVSAQATKTKKAPDEEYERFWKPSPSEKKDAESALAAQRRGDSQEALTRFKKLGLEGNLFAIETLGNFYQTGFGVQQNYSTAIQLFKACAMAGSPSCQHDLAAAYNDGIMVPVNKSLAVEYFAAAAAQHYLLSYIPLARHYASGEGGTRDEEKSALWKTRAMFAVGQYKADRRHDADGWVAGVCDELAYWSLEKSSFEEAARLFNQANELIPDHVAEEQLGVLYWNGQGVPKQPETALSLWLKAADQLDGSAYLDLARAYRDEQHRIPEDNIQSCTWLLLASQVGAITPKAFRDGQASLHLSSEEQQSCAGKAAQFARSHTGQPTTYFSK